MASSNSTENTMRRTSMSLAQWFCERTEIQEHRRNSPTHNRCNVTTTTHRLLLGVAELADQLLRARAHQLGQRKPDIANPRLFRKIHLVDVLVLAVGRQRGTFVVEDLDQELL
jgi:hypothetical protein